MGETTITVDVKLCHNRLHPMVPENIKVRPNGARTCRECIRAADRRRNIRDRDKRKASASRRYARDPEKYRDLRLKREFGISLADYERMLAEQGDRCAICRGNDPVGKYGKRFAVDHDHATNKVRGLLCQHCNVMLGNAKDDPANLRAAADYLERSQR